MSWWLRKKVPDEVLELAAALLKHHERTRTGLEILGLELNRRYAEDNPSGFLEEEHIKEHRVNKNKGIKSFGYAIRVLEEYYHVTVYRDQNGSYKYTGGTRFDEILEDDELLEKSKALQERHGDKDLHDLKEALDERITYKNK